MIQHYFKQSQGFEKANIQLKIPHNIDGEFISMFLGNFA
jgi:hypothetical protein